ncbi:hypothetical protein Vadar_016344 [Vaccinium darrowii]|uniref:Uncharacterized protein n=1 Tax=Vaccinium darrowii TaxID=229202 RepID=A0ACB7YWW7_9ERIC|nr:hypothetical protein Vadar_016344 [Vaccinium darrowii]
MGEEGEKIERESTEESEGFGRGPAMDTPNRNQITTPLSQFEDSPVFNYINSLSPIKTVKSTRISQTLSSFSFATLPSIFTSPHVSSLKETRFLKRHQFSDPSKPEFSSDNDNKGGAIEGVMDVSHTMNEQQQYLDRRNSIGEAEPTYECSELAIEVSRTLIYDCGSPDCSATPSNGIESKYVSELAGTSSSALPSAQEASETGFLGNGVHLRGISMIENNNEDAGRDWESLISGTSGLLIFDSPDEGDAFKGHFRKPLDSGTRSCSSLMLEFPLDGSTQSLGRVGAEHHELENPRSQVGEEGRPNEIEATGDILASTCPHKHVAEPSEQIDNEPNPNLHRGIRRRCLVFETGGACNKHLDDSSSSCSSFLSQSDVNMEPNTKQLVPMKTGTESSRCIVPGIGLHLNALARTSKNYSVSSLEVRTSLNKSFAVSTEINAIPSENGVQGIEDTSLASGYIANEEFNQSSPKKKRHVQRKLENAGESEGCKRCNCKKSKCLKLYCECFAAGVYCVEPCSCIDCFNKPVHEDTVLSTRKQIESRNPLAFAPKVIRSSDSVQEDESSKTPASARHKRGCNCKKSGCLKKYCECYQGGVGCSINCRCEGCKNAFGRKDGSALIGAEAELEEEEETETYEKSVINRSLQKNVIQNSVEQNLDSTLPATPLQCGRESVQLPFSSKSKPPRSSFLSIGSSSSFYGSQRFGKPNVLQPQPKFEKRIQAVPENEMPEILQGNCSPISGIKSASPNSKRVSPPHCSDFGVSPGRGSRKLILRSIPSFPSLNAKD